MAKKTQKYIIIGVGLLLAVFLVFGRIVEPCVMGQNLQPYCKGGDVVQPVCSSGLVTNDVVSCGDGTSCNWGKCLSETCTSSSNVCITNYTFIERQCVGGKYIDDYHVCRSGEYCSNGMCRTGGSNCGDGICGSGEDTLNCLKDCGSLSSWDNLAKEISANSELNTYLKCGGVFDCQTSEVKNLADKIMGEYAVKTPREYVDAVNTYVYNYITYRLDGGNQQCGESASGMIKTKESTGQFVGNCVDYATLSTSLLRSKGIPSRQVGGCLTSLNFQCVAFAVKPPSLEGLHYGNMNSQQPLAHSYIEVWVDKTVGWAIADPTVGQTVSKCIDYKTMDRAGGTTNQVCYLSGNYQEECKWSG